MFSTLHYRLRLIESGNQRFLNFASHFICLQIFQIDFSAKRLILSASKYSRYILGDEMHNYSLELSRKRVELNVCESFKYFTKELWCKYLKKIFAILKVRFHHERGLSQSRYFELFFSTRYEASPQKKSALTEPPFLLFLTFGLISSYFVS